MSILLLAILSATESMLAVAAGRSVYRAVATPLIAIASITVLTL